MPGFGHRDSKHWDFQWGSRGHPELSLQTLGNLTMAKCGDGSKPWYLVNPKIAGKWMFIPLKCIYRYWPIPMSIPLVSSQNCRLSIAAHQRFRWRIQFLSHGDGGDGDGGCDSSRISWIQRRPGQLMDLIWPWFSHIFNISSPFFLVCFFFWLSLTILMGP